MLHYAAIAGIIMIRLAAARYGGLYLLLRRATFAATAGRSTLRWATFSATLQQVAARYGGLHLLLRYGRSQHATGGYSCCYNEIDRQEIIKSIQQKFLGH